MPRRTFLTVAAAVLTLSLLATACGGAEEEAPVTPSAPVTPTVEEVPAGEYAYSAYGVKAVMLPEGDDGTFSLSVTNKTGSALAKPGIYALDAVDGHQIPGTVEGSKPLGNGQTGEYTVTFGPDLKVGQVGLMLLEFGSANWGAFTSGNG